MSTTETPVPFATALAGAQQALRRDKDSLDYYRRLQQEWSGSSKSSFHKQFDAHIVELDHQIQAVTALCDMAQRMHEVLHHIHGYTLIAEDSQIRPAAMSYVKPSEFAVLVRQLVHDTLCVTTPPDTTV